MDGLILFGFTDCDMQQVAEWQHRVVVIATEETSVSSINYDNQRVIELALEHLLAQSLRHIAYIGVNPEDRTTRSGTSQRLSELVSATSADASLSNGQIEP